MNQKYRKGITGIVFIRAALIAAKIQKMTEEAKVAVRNIRREANDKCKDMKKSGDMTEDEQKASEKNIQDLTDKYVKLLENVQAAKEKEIMSI